MTVRVTRPEFNLRKKLSELDKPTGLKGSELMSSETTQDARNLVAAGRRNLFINGACQVKQRGSSFTSAGFTADHWYMYATGGTTTIETSSPPSGFTYYLQAASATSSCIFSQALELEKQGSAGQFKEGRIMTVSWYAKTTAADGEEMKLNASFRSGSTSGTNSVSLNDGPNSIHGNNLGGGEVKITNSWARYSRTFEINVSPHSTSKLLVMQLRTPSGAIGTVSLTGFQCEFGSEPTEFEHKSYAEEFESCERYYQLIGGLGSADNNLTTNTDGFHAYTGWSWADPSASARIMLRQRMARTPDVTIVGTISGGTGMGNGKYGVYGGASNAWQTPGSWNVNDINDHSFRVNAASYSTFGLGKAVGFYMYGGAGFKIDAEL